MQTEKLKMKLEHLAGHNSSHAAGFRKQAHEAGELGFKDVEAELLQAAENLDRAGIHLRRTIGKLGGQQD